LNERKQIRTKAAAAPRWTLCTRIAFRHDPARRVVDAVDLPTVAAWLGHERVYIQPDEEALERAASALEKSCR